MSKRNDYRSYFINLRKEKELEESCNLLIGRHYPDMVRRMGLISLCKLRKDDEPMLQYFAGLVTIYEMELDEALDMEMP